MRFKMLATGLLMTISAATMAEAMPMTGAPAPAGITSNRVLVDYACGPGFHITRYGDCVRWRGPPPPPPPPWGRHRYYGGWDGPPPPPPPPWARHRFEDDWGGPPPPPPPWGW